MEIVEELPHPEIAAPSVDKKGFLEDLLDRVLTAKTEPRSVAKKVKAATKKEPYSWAKYAYAGDGNKLQMSGMSRKERFPIIFDRVKELKPDAKRVLSFGCSVGHEIEALSKRFADAELVGVDIDHYSIQQARRNVKLPNVYFVDELGPCGKFDVVTALMVFFCVEQPIPKNRFIENLTNLSKHVNEGGVLAIYTSDYDPMEVLGDEYEVISAYMREHNVNKKQYFNGYFRRRGLNSAP